MASNALTRFLGGILPGREPSVALSAEVEEQKGLVGRPPIITIPVAQFFDLVESSFAGRSLNPRSAWSTDSLVYACVQFRSAKFAEPPLWIAEEKDGDEEWVKDHALADLLEQPTPDHEMGEWLELVSQLMDMDGELLLVKTRNGAGRVVRLYPYASGSFTVEPAGDVLYGKFTISSDNGTRTKTLTPDDVIYLRDSNPVDYYTPRSRVDAALAKLNLGADIVRSIKATLRKGMRPGAVLTMKTVPTKPQLDMIKSEIENNYAGAQNDGKVFIAAGEGAALTPLNPSLEKLTTGPAMFDVESATCQVFQVHPLLVNAKLGIEGNTGLADSIGPATLLFYDVTGIPRWTRFERRLTRALLREIDPNKFRQIRFDKSKVESLRKDLKGRADTAVAAREFWTVDEARVYTDKKPLPNKEGEQIIAEMHRPDFSGLGGFGADPDDDDDEQFDDEEKSTAPTSVKRSSFDNASPAAIKFSRNWVHDQFEMTIQLAAFRCLSADLGAISSAVAGAKASAVPLSAEQGEAAIKRIRIYLEKRSPAKWRKEMQPALESAGRVAVQQLAGELGISFSLLQPGLLKFVKRHVGHLITNITPRTLEDSIKAIHDGIAAGEGIPEIQRRLQESAGFGSKRAELIARTETTTATNGVQVETLSEYAKSKGGKVWKTWLNADDDKVRDEHLDVSEGGVSGEKVGIDDTFSNGLEHPQEPNCRCTLVYEIEEAA